MKWIIAAAFLFMGIKIFAPELLPSELGGGPLPVRAVSVEETSEVMASATADAGEGEAISEDAPAEPDPWAEANRSEGSDESGSQDENGWNDGAQQNDGWGEQAPQDSADNGWDDQSSWGEPAGEQPYDGYDNGESGDDMPVAED